MKFIKNIFKLAALGMLFASCALPAMAQRGWDLFSVPRYFVYGPTNLKVATAVYSNAPIDLLPMTGIGNLLITCQTNTGSNGMICTATIYTSTDATNWTSVSNFALITNNTSLIFTNTTYGGFNAGSLTNTNTVLLPGTVTTPNAASAGFATSYLAPILFTNAAGAISMQISGETLIGLNLDNLGRYLSVAFTPTGTTTNETVGFVLQGYLHNY